MVTRESPEGWWWLVGLLGPFTFGLVPFVFVIWIASRLLRRGPAGVRTRIGEDGFWIYSPDATRGRPISYRARVDGIDRNGTVASPGSQGEYVYMGGKVTDVRILAMAAAADAFGQALAAREDDDRWRRDREDREWRRSSSRHPPAY